MTGHELNGARVLVVGGARDIGLAIVKAVAAAGGTPIIGARTPEKGQKAASSVPGAEFVRIDITDENSIVSGLSSAGHVDHVVVTTSAQHNTAVTKLDHDLTLGAFEAKIIGPLMLIKHLAPTLPPTGSVVLFAGVAAWDPSPGYTVMGITNGAVSFAASQLAKELAPLRVNAISPGIIDSGSYDVMSPKAKHDFLEKSAKHSLVGRVGDNRDITDAVLWLLTASYVTGETLHVDGGTRFA